MGRAMISLFDTVIKCLRSWGVLKLDASPIRFSMPSQTPFVKLSFIARSRSPVFTILKMRSPIFLIFFGIVAGVTVAAETPRPRGVGPECSTPLPKTVSLA